MNDQEQTSRPNLAAPVERTRVQILDGLCGIPYGVLIEGDALLTVDGACHDEAGESGRTAADRVDELRQDINEAVDDAAAFFLYKLYDYNGPEFKDYLQAVSDLDDALACLVHLRQSLEARGEEARRRAQGRGDAP